MFGANPQRLITLTSFSHPNGLFPGAPVWAGSVPAAVVEALLLPEVRRSRASIPAWPPVSGTPCGAGINGQRSVRPPLARWLLVRYCGSKEASPPRCASYASSVPPPTQIFSFLLQQPRCSCCILGKARLALADANASVWFQTKSRQTSGSFLTFTSADPTKGLRFSEGVWETQRSANGRSSLCFNGRLE